MHKLHAKPGVSPKKICSMLHAFYLIPLSHLTEFRQPLQVQSHLEMPGILVQLGHIQRT